MFVCISVYVYVCVYVHAFVYVYVYVCMYIYIHIYIGIYACVHFTNTYSVRARIHADLLTHAHTRDNAHAHVLVRTLNDVCTHKHTHMSVAREVKSVDLRSHASDWAWVRKPQLTYLEYVHTHQHIHMSIHT